MEDEGDTAHDDPGGESLQTMVDHQRAAASHEAETRAEKMRREQAAEVHVRHLDLGRARREAWHSAVQQLRSEAGAPASGRLERDEEAGSGPGQEQFGGPDDCPVSFSLEAISECMPRALSKVTGTGPSAQRIWATLLAVAVAEKLDATWLARLLLDSRDSGSADADSDSDDLAPTSQVDPEPDVPRTIVDKGRSYLERLARTDDRLRGVMPLALDKARYLVVEWGREQTWRIGQLRNAEIGHNTKNYAHNTLTVAGGNVLKSIIDGHNTLSCFLSDVLEMERWQSLMLMMTLLLCALLIQIWFYSSQSAVCCAQMRAMLDDGSGTVCPPDPLAPCRGFTGAPACHRSAGSVPRPTSLSCAPSAAPQATAPTCRRSSQGCKGLSRATMCATPSRTAPATATPTWWGSSPSPSPSRWRGS